MSDSPILDRYARPIESRGAVSTLSNPQDWLIDAFGGGSVKANVNVNETAMLGVAAFYAGVNAISSDIGLMVKKLMAYDQPTDTVSWLRSHPFERVLNVAPNQEMTAMSFWSSVIAHAIGWGGGFAEIIRDRSGRVVALELIDPTSVTMLRDGDGSIVYRVLFTAKDYTAKYVAVDLRSDQVFHVFGLSFDGLTGYQLAKIAKESFGIAIATQDQSATFFANGMTPSGILEHPAVMSDESFRRLRQSFQERYAGSANASKPIILEEGTKWQQLGVEPEKSQMIQSMQFSIENVARWLRIPLSKLHHLLKANFATLEMQNQEYYDDALLPWKVRVEQEIQIKLMGALPENYYVELDMSTKLRGDQNARSSYYREVFNIGSLTPNEVRKGEGLNPLPEGNETWIQLNMAPARAILRKQELEIEKTELEIEKLRLEVEGMRSPPDPVPLAIPFDPEPPDAEEADPEEDMPSENTDTAPEDSTRALCEALENAHKPLISSAFARLLRVVGEKNSRMAHKEGHLDWQKGFIREHSAYALPILSEPIAAFLASRDAVLGRSDVNTDLIPRISDQYLRFVEYAIAENRTRGIEFNAVAATLAATTLEILRDGI